MASQTVYDVIIVGAGPAGLAAGLYTARDRYKTLLLERNGLPGGQILLTEHVENYPGYVKIGGFELIEQMKQQVLRFGAELAVNKSVDAIVRQGDGTLVVTVNRGKASYQARAVILALGSDYRQLGVPGESEMRQAGKVSYCATCDGAFFRDKHVLAVGGGNTAVEDAVYLATRFAKKTTVIHRREEFRAQKVIVEALYAAAKSHDVDIKLPFVLDAIVPSADKAAIDHALIRNVNTGSTEKLAVDGVFIFVGMNPNTGWLKGLLPVDENGYVPADPRTMKTAVPGVFIVGDCRQGADMQLVAACADGVAAALQLKAFFRESASWPVDNQADEPGDW